MVSPHPVLDSKARVARVEIVSGDIFTSKCQALVCPVNCVGVMGKGLALVFRSQFEEHGLYKRYREALARGTLAIGKPQYLIPAPGSVNLPGIVLFATKRHWRDSSNLLDIVDSLNVMKASLPQWGVESIAVPALGCGEGGLKWKDVGNTLYRRLQKFGIRIELYLPFDLTAL